MLVSGNYKMSVTTYFPCYNNTPLLKNKSLDSYPNQSRIQELPLGVQRWLVVCQDHWRPAPPSVRRLAMRLQLFAFQSLSRTADCAPNQGPRLLDSPNPTGLHLHTKIIQLAKLENTTIFYYYYLPSGSVPFMCALLIISTDTSDQ